MKSDYDTDNYPKELFRHEEKIKKVICKMNDECAPISEYLGLRGKLIAVLREDKTTSKKN